MPANISLPFPKESFRVKRSNHAFHQHSMYFCIPMIRQRSCILVLHIPEVILSPSFHPLEWHTYGNVLLVVLHHNDTFKIFQSKWTFLSYLKSMHFLWEYALRPCKILFLFHIHPLVLASNILYCYYDDY